MLRSNTIAPLKVAGLFDQHLPVLAKDQEVFVADLMAKQPPMSLEDFEDLLEDLDGQSEAIRLKCADAVRTGIYRYLELAAYTSAYTCQLCTRATPSKYRGSLLTTLVVC